MKALDVTQRFWRGDSIGTIQVQGMQIGQSSQRLQRGDPISIAQVKELQIGQSRQRLQCPGDLSGVAQVQIYRLV